MNLKEILTVIWKWDKSFPAYKAVQTPKNVVEKCLQIHEQVEYDLLKNHYFLEKTDYTRFYKLYLKAHQKANKEMLIFLRTQIKELTEPQYRNAILKRILIYFWSKYYPINQQEKDYKTGKNAPKIKTDMKATVFNIIYFYIQGNEVLNEIEKYIAIENQQKEISTIIEAAIQ